MKTITAFLLIFAIFYGSLPLVSAQTQTTTTLPEGCTSKEGYSQKSGIKCDTVPETKTETFSETKDSDEASKPTPLPTGQLVDYWSNKEDCLAATSAPFYHPVLRAKDFRPIDKKTEKIVGHPTGGCFQMDLPDRKVSPGWVRIEAGREMVINKQTSQYERLAWCFNRLYDFAPFPAQKSLKVTNTTNITNTYNVYKQDMKCKEGETKDGVHILECGGITVAIKDGVDGRGCHWTKNADDSYTVACDGQEGSFTIKSGKNGKDGFCSGTLCKIVIGIVVAVAVISFIRCVVQKKCGGLVKTIIQTVKGPDVVTNPAGAGLGVVTNPISLLSDKPMSNRNNLIFSPDILTDSGTNFTELALE